ncbi:ffdbc64b-3cd6-4d6d-850f-379d78cce0a6 [Sclerotinia trifoliorum]|uniref:Carboxylic ester hydrolase n=1 Tax=Sclerotinia trifoliorum TaxID=28548 RepID=A0A8H2W0D4_9HELO|nr:ffdbc64b-3cd6-4d6d-850f-379d78cce0a6 [Sclerotinia trifoliorum]
MHVESQLPQTTHPIIDHSSLGTVLFGNAYGDSSATEYKEIALSIWQFSGIKYGKIPARFMQAELNEEFEDMTECYHYGPKCPQVKMPVRMEDGLIGLPKEVASHAEDVFDEFNCLNLNITTPDGSNENSELPVMVYIHGGGGWSGANSDWWCDGRSIVKQSIKIGKPIVHVAINYRLGPFGYMGSEELRKELGVVHGGNYGLRDIHLALTWLSKYSRPFGGSPSNLTIYGESAGSLAVESQIHCLLPPHFHRAIMQSQTMGQPLFSVPQCIDQKSQLYNKTKEKLGLTSVKEMQEVNCEKLMEAYRAVDARAGLGELAMVDGEFFDEDWRTRFSFKRNARKYEGRKSEIMIGNTGREGSVIKFIMIGSPKQDSRPETETLMTALTTLISTEKVNEILKAYNLLPNPFHKTSSETEQTKFAEQVLTIIEDLIFYKGTAEFVALAQKSRPELRIGQYIFKQKNPFSTAGIFKGVEVHALDLVYLHGSGDIFGEIDRMVDLGVEDKERELRMMQEMQKAWIRFAYGEDDGVDGVGAVKVFGPDGKVGGIGIEELMEERGYERWKVFDGLSNREMEGVAGVLLQVYGGLVGEG